MADLEPRENDTLLDRISAQWRPLLVLTLAGIAAASIATVMRKPVWQAETTLLVPPPSFSLANLTGTSAASSFASSINGPSILRINKMLLESDRALTTVLRKAGLPGSITEQKRALIRMRDVQTEQTSNSITLTIRHENPETARKISHLYVQALRQLSRTLNVQKSGGEADAVEETLRAKQADLRAAESKLQQFQERARTSFSMTPSPGGASGQPDSGSPIVTSGDWLTQLRNSEIALDGARRAYQALIAGANKALSLSGKAPTVIPFTEKLRQAVIEKETGVSLIANKYGPDSPELLRAQRDLKVAQNQLQQEVARYQQSLNLGVSDPALAEAALKEAQLQGRVEALRQLAAQAPIEARQYMELYRRVSVLSAITTRLESQLSLASIARSNDPNAWNVVDDAVVGDRPVNKSFIRNGALGAGAGFMLGLIGVLLRSGGKRSKPTRTRPSQYDAQPDGI
ncbi:MAG: hypothetical protein EOP84_00180 [Verrucomicrobiaceae bacterium]|nr:MAG: hypothetical protein EOP84_00180 [Verrucomicrobiaceae bacterium]